MSQRFAYVLAGFSLIVLFASLSHATPVRNQIPDVVRAKRFEVVDDTGTMRGQLHYNDNGSSLTLFNKKGESTVVLTVPDKGGAMLILRDKQQNITVDIGILGTEGGMSVRRSNQDASINTSIRIATSAPDHAGIFVDAKQRIAVAFKSERTSLALGTEKNGGIVISDSPEKGRGIRFDYEDGARLVLSSTKQAAGVLLAGPELKGKAALMLTEGLPELLLEDRDGKIIKP